MSSVTCPILNKNCVAIDVPIIVKKAHKGGEESRATHSRRGCIRRSRAEWCARAPDKTVEVEPILTQELPKHVHISIHQALTNSPDVLRQLETKFAEQQTLFERMQAIAVQPVGRMSQRFVDRRSGHLHVKGMMRV